MSKKVFIVILIPALLLISGYITLQVFLRTGNENTEKDGQVTAQSISEQKGKQPQNSELGSPAGKDKPAVEEGKKEGQDAGADAVKAKDTLSRGNASPLDLRPLFIKKMQDLVKKSSNGLYNLSVGGLDVDILASTVALHKVSLRPDAQAVKRMKATGLLPESIINASFESLLIDGINLDDAINSKSMDYKLIKLVNPHIELEQLKKSKKKNDEDFSQRFLKEMDKLAIKQVEVDGGNIIVHDKTKGSTQKLQQVQIRMKDILLNDATRKDKDRFLFAKQAELDFRDFSMKSGDGLYDLKIGNVAVKATQKKVVLKNFTYSSTLSKEEFVKKHKTAKSMYDVTLPSVTINGIDWWPALNGEEVAAGEVELKGGEISVYFDRALPREKKYGKFPNQMLAKLPLRVDVEKVKIGDLDIAYEEKSIRSEQSATIYFDNVSADIMRINNSKKNNKPLTMNATALFMKEVPMKVAITLDMDNPEKGNFTAALQMDGFDTDVVNSFAKPLGLVKIERGEIKELKADIKGNEMGATGDVKVRYDKLRISMWKKKKGEEELKKKHLMTFVANLLAIKNNNPWWLDGQLRQKEPQFKRDPDDSFLALVWKTMFTGILKTVGAPPKAAKGK